MSIKHQLYKQCKAYVAERIQRSQEAIDAAQEAANNESKSSAGDKHETGRAMAQLEKEKNLQQMAETLKLKKALQQIRPDEVHTTITFGSVIHTSNGNFFVAIGAGKLVVDGTTYFAISPTSPIGLQLKGLTQGDTCTFNGRKIAIKAVY